MSADFAALISAARLREAIDAMKGPARCLSIDRPHLDVLLAAAEAHLATMPEPKDCAVVHFRPDQKVLVVPPGLMSRADAEMMARALNVTGLRYGHNYVVVQRPS